MRNVTWPHTDFDLVFEGGRFGDFDVRARHVGDLEIASGSVRVCDPDGESSIEVSSMPTGTFPVEVAIAKEGDYESAAALRVVFRRERAATWEVQPGRRMRPLPPFEDPGVSIATGWVVLVDDASDHASVDFEVGTHDRTYPIYVGRTSVGHATALAVDFDVLAVPQFDLIELALPLRVGKQDDPRFALVGVEAWATSPSDLELRGDIARICSGRVGDRSAPPFAPIIQTRPDFMQRFTFPAKSGPAFVRIYVGRKSLEKVSAAAG
jgi:hypothetical protein